MTEWGGWIEGENRRAFMHLMPVPVLLMYALAGTEEDEHPVTELLHGVADQLAGFADVGLDTGDDVPVSIAMLSNMERRLRVAMELLRRLGSATSAGV